MYYVNAIIHAMARPPRGVVGGCPSGIPQLVMDSLINNGWMDGCPRPIYHTTFIYTYSYDMIALIHICVYYHLCFCDV